MFSVECHCGNIKITANALPSSITSCNCSICNRLGALWAYFDLENVETLSGGKLIAINCRMAPSSETSNIPIREFDGLVTWKYLDE